MIFFESNPRQRSGGGVCCRKFSIATLVLLVLGTLAFPPSARAQDFHMELVAHVGGLCRGIQMEGGRVYLCEGSKLSIFDVSDPANPVRMGEVSVPDPLYSIHVSGNLAVAEGRLTRAYLFDISNPWAPTVLSSIDAESGSFSPACHIAGNALLIATSKGQFVFDITNPQSPALRSSITGFADVAGQGPLVYGVAHGYLHVYDLSNPAAPLSRGAIPVSGSGSIALEGNLVCTAGGTNLDVISIINPTAPTIVGHLEFPYSVAAFSISGNLAYVGRGGLVHVIDISNPALPQERSIYNTTNRDSAYVSSSDSVFTYADLEGFEVVDTSNPTAPVRVGAHHSGVAEAQAVSVSDDIACVASYAGLGIVDVSNPLNPNPVGSYRVRLVLAYVQLDGNVAYLSNGDVVDVSNPAMPIVRTTYGAPTYLYAVSDNLGFFCKWSSDDSLYIYDISNPFARRLLGSRRISPDPYELRAYDADVAGDTAFVASGAPLGRLLILDVSDPSVPTPVYSYSAGKHVRSVEVREGHAYIGTDRGFEILDVSTPSQPRFMSRPLLAKSDDIVGVRLSGDLAFVSFWRTDSTEPPNGVHVFDIHDPSAPSLVGFYALPRVIPRFDVVGNTAYIPGQEHGLWALRYTGPVLAARPSWQLYE